MKFKELKQKIKEEQKELAAEIRLGKSGRKPKNRNDDNYDAWDDLEWNRDDYRHKHIMYCYMFNNTPYEKIENPREGNKPSSYELERIKKEWESMLDEVVCDCA